MHGRLERCPQQGNTEVGSSLSGDVNDVVDNVRLPSVCDAGEFLVRRVATFPVVRSLSLGLA